MKLQPRHIPNILTIIRILLTPVIVIFLLVPFGHDLYHFNTGMGKLTFQLSFILAGILFVLACLTDGIDGYLARKNN
jgi:CDP-diacylglycerol--glycerol-3-phosphate 3-phosphatidyltransferase